MIYSDAKIREIEKSRRFKKADSTFIDGMHGAKETEWTFNQWQPRRGAMWSAEEIDHVRHLADEATGSHKHKPSYNTFAVIAWEIGRSSNAVYAKLLQSKLGLSILNKFEFPA